MEKFDPEKLLRIASAPLRPRRKPQPEALPGLFYATFNRRMIAQMIDSFLTVLLLAPPIEIFSTLLFGPLPHLDFSAMVQALSIPNGEGIGMVIDAMAQSGLVGRWLAGAVMELGVLGVITVLFWDYFSATPGKMLLRLAVVDAASLQPITNRQAMVRFFAYFASAAPFLLGFFWVAISRRRQGWHDLIAGTVVVVLPKGKTAWELVE